MTDSNRHIITVSELNRDAKRLIESEFPVLYVEGEISNFARPSSGHWYFTLKDDKAQLRCAMFRQQNLKVRFQPDNGQQIIVQGRVSLYEGRGEFQMIAEFLEEAGDGALRRAYEKLKAQLQDEGLFATTAKQPLPRLPQHLAVITSPSGAAIHDVLTVIQRRFPAMQVSILPVQVQGDNSVGQIVEAIAQANRWAGEPDHWQVRETSQKYTEYAESAGKQNDRWRESPFDLILLTRGGGSLEDLWSFNTEPVARAIAASHLPVVTAIGHESDVCIADLVADLRAPTPSAAAELITPDGDTWLDTLKDLAQRMMQLMSDHITHNRREMTHLNRRLRHPRERLNDLNQRLDDMERRLISQSARNLDGYQFGALHRRLLAAVNRELIRYRARLAGLRLIPPVAALIASQGRLQHLQEKLHTDVARIRSRHGGRLLALTGKLQTLSPLATLERGYAILANADNVVVTRARDLQPGDRITARLMQGSLVATVNESLDDGDGTKTAKKQESE